MTDSCLDELKKLLGEILHLGKRTAALREDTRLVGSLPELDSMAAIAIIVEIEERFQITFDAEEVTGEIFQTVGTLASTVDRKRLS